MILFLGGCRKFDEIEASKVEMNDETIERGWDYIKISGEYDYPVELETMTLYISEKEDMSGAKTYGCVIDGKTFSVEADDLKDGTKYHYQYEYDNGYVKEKGEKEDASTIDKPIVVTKDAGGITTISAVLTGEVTNNDAANEIEERGFCWATEPHPTIAGTHHNCGGDTGVGTSTFSHNISNLQDNATYYFRAYVKTNFGVIYGEEKSFKTLQNIELPTVTTTNVSNITQTTATCGGNVTSDGGANVTARGVCWSEIQNPNIDNIYCEVTTDGTGTGTFTSQLTNLKENTIYYVRSYATNEKGTAYGEEKSFKTLDHFNGHEYVDLGLPSGLKWATCNVGASSPEDYGDYFAWGETETKTEYTQDNSLTYGLTKSELQLQGYIDGSGNLTPSHDAATANWGGSWRMPTKEEQQELIDNCTWTWTTQNGVKGCKVTGPNGNSIFLPAAGLRRGSSLYDDGNNGYYWSSTPLYYYDANGYYACGLTFSGGGRLVSAYDRSDGLTVRPITE